MYALLLIDGGQPARVLAPRWQYKSLRHDTRPFASIADNLDTGAGGKQISCRR
jgi:hypothetical protein